MNKTFILLVSFVAALGGLLFGFDTAIISGTIPYITEYFSLNEYMLGWAVSSLLIGCAIGAVLAGKIADVYGRKTTLIICAVLFAVSGIGAGLSQQLTGFIGYRLIGGLGVGAAALVSPMYIAEIAPANWRGRLVAFYQLAIVLGILLAYFSNYVFDGWGANNWRWMFISQAVPSVLFLFFLLFVPESPRWMMKKGHEARSLQVLSKISGDVAARKELAEIKGSFQTHEPATLKILFSRSYRSVVIIGILVAVFQQVTGINSILYYAPVIFRETGLDSSSSLLQTLGIGFVNVVATFIAIGLVDKVGRKKFLLAGCLLMGLSLVIVGLCFHYKYFSNYIVLLGMLVYVGAFGCTLGAVTWVYLSEIFPNRIRALALSVATLSLWIADFIVTYTFPVLSQQLGTAVTMLSYAALCAIAFLYMQFQVKETKNKSLEEIETLFVK
ncbi:arabinose-proton symporter [Parapedobacter defluvii]|uniref:Arabinose-proton symporter n=1 Tax=Parapedobacter defluvii TaxID=2045106 RepID=A0ABQ1KZ25_9SPHI|nr:sugar porter family MFS transporter [Parapedobacter defluvii]GGC13233.1 arabinose-proton symporter [Parapedobacter defluvii]